MRLAPWAAALVLLAACNTTKMETPQQLADRLRVESDSARVAIETANAAFARYAAAGQADSVAAIYGEQAILYLAGAPPVMGRTAIAAKFREILGSGTWTMNVMTTSVEASGPLAVETGRNIMSFTPAPTAPAGTAAMTDTVAYVTTWRKLDGKWVLMNDIGVSTKAPPPAVPARRR